MSEKDTLQILKQIREYLSIIRNTVGWILFWVFLIYLHTCIGGIGGK